MPLSRCVFSFLFAVLITLAVTPVRASEGEELIGDRASSTSLALSHWKTACREGEGSASACAKIGAAYFSGFDSVAANEGDGLRYMHYGCNGGLASACADVATMYFKQGRLNEARTANRVACDKGDSGGCRNLAVMMATGQGGIVDTSGSKEMAQKACDMGESDICEAAAKPNPSGYDDYHAAFGRGDAQDMPGMMALMKTSCYDGNYYDACDVIARRSIEGTEWPKDLVLARAALRQACAVDWARGCARYAGMLERGEGGNEDAALAFVLYERACDDGDGDGCYGKARMMYEGRLGPVDMTIVAGLLDRSCKDRGWQGCVLLAKILRHGDGTVAADPQRAGDLYGMDCNNRYTQSCFEYGSMLVNGELGGPSEDQLRYAKDAYARGCRNNVAAACDAAKAMDDKAVPAT